MFTVLRSIFVFGLGLYVGIGVAISLAGPAVFRSLESRTLAGNTFATLLRATTRVDVALGAGLGIAAVLWLPRAVSGGRRTLAAGALALMLAAIGYYTFILTPAMNARRARISTFDTAEVSVDRAVFDDLHQRYVRVYSLSMVLAMVAAGLASGLAPATGVRRGETTPRDTAAADVPSSG